MSVENPKLEWAKEWLETTKQLYINGKWKDSSSNHQIDSINPATGQVLGHIQEATRDDVDQAVTAAQNAFKRGPWPSMGRKARANVMRRIAEVIRMHRAELATLEALDNGKLYKEAYYDDLGESADIFEYYAGWTDKIHGETMPVEGEFLNYTLRVPVGVCGQIVPWNYPMLMSTWKLAPALATGNTVVLKPSSATPFSVVRLFEILHDEQVLPPGVINLILGSGKTGSYISSHLEVNKVSFTGSTAVGKQLVHDSADSNLKTVTLELGGKSPNIIFNDPPDVEYAIERSFTGLFTHKGEKCSSPTRLFVHRSLYDYTVTRLAELADRYVLGDPFDPRSDQGAQCTKSHMEKILEYIEIGKAEGARVAAGGGRDMTGSNANGYFVRPTILADVTNSMRVAQEEIFGPVLVVIPFDDDEEVIEMANDTIYGLAAGLWTKDITRAHRIAARLDAGAVFINKYGCYDLASPFGGFKESGWGKECGIQSLDSYTKVKSIWVNLN
ncbi:aldehyde dehydrogenase family protein [Paenibacillus sp. LMG 31458]|uniref:Aldehyde dehydrogenase family protein n=1 Tax=Paenibacillus phytorum TaxID=2654977 RepID=A0ABX1Y414_9BACL|nr:aldehyde dehydrogenase family protein [Paenibacillus phytorum]